jgi:membrane fusion protein (multidrug efflux system)
MTRNSADAMRLEADAASLDQQLELAREELVVAQRELDRVEKLLERGVATTSDRDAEVLRVSVRRTTILRLEADAKRNGAQRASNQAEAKELTVSLRQARTNLSRAVVHAPYAGRIEARLVQPGSRVAPGSALFELVDLTRVEIPVALPASRFGHIETGTEASVRLPGSGGEPWTAKVVRLAPSVRADDRTYVVYLESGGERVVPPGAFVTATFEGQRYANVFAVPRTAFVGKRIFVVEGEVARERVPVIVRSLPAVVLCESGIEVGDRIIVTNLEQVADGTRITATDEDTEAKDA